MVASKAEIAWDAIHIASARKIPFQPHQNDLRYLLNERELAAETVYVQEYRARTF
jgi:hypothetical protein